MVFLIAKFALLMAGLLVPGDALMRMLRVRRTIASCFAGSVLALHVAVLVLHFSGIRISLASLSGTLALIAIVAAGIAWAGPPPPTITRFSRLRPWCFRLGAWTPLYVIFWLVVLVRLWHEPLSGPDVEFRWAFLAEQMLRLGSLGFYPPLSPQDFVSYFWVESIPPGVSALHAWAFACAGSFSPAWTIPATVLQLWALHEMLWRTAERIDGQTAAQFTCIAAIACPLLTWATIMGQETGLTALSLVGLACSVHGWQLTRDNGWAALGGVFAALGAMAREYGYVFPVFATIGFLAVGADGKAWRHFLPLAYIGVVWPLRSLFLTGNPFFSLPLAGLPVNERFVAWIEHDAEAFGSVLRTAAGWGDVLRLLLLYAPLGLVGWIGFALGTARGRRDALAGLLATLVIMVLWAASVRYTNGGLFYSLRVTSPALALGALGAGIGLAYWSAGGPGRTRLGGGIVLVAAILLLPSTLALPLNPRQMTASQWRAFAPWLPPPRAEPDDRTVAIVLHALHGSAATDRRVIIADAPGYQRRFRETGVDVIPLWSPQADWLFDPTLSNEDALRKWQESGVTHLVVTKWQANLNFFHTHSRWSRPPFHARLVGESDLTAVFSIGLAE